MFRISDIDFEIASCKLDAFVDEDGSSLCWGFEVNASSRSPSFPDWTAKFSSEQLTSTAPGVGQKWRELAFFQVEWTEKNDNDKVPSAYLYVFEHLPVGECRVEIYGVHGNLRLRVNAVCDVFYDETYSENLPLRIDCPIDFKGILCGRRTEAESREELSPYLDHSEFDFVQDEYGVSLLRPITAL
ncbi:hypothetical protein MRY87_10590 [bacterium]|nr:hypothetical protein [bacterium]